MSQTNFRNQGVAEEDPRQVDPQMSFFPKTIPYTLNIFRRPPQQRI